MKPRLDKAGYYRLTLKVIEPFKRRTVHSLVAEAFVDGYFEGAIVNHKDENKTNNRADNLEWVTYRQNSNYGNAKQRQIEKQIRPVEQLSEEGIILNTYKSVSEAAIAVGTSTSHISAAIRENKRKRAGGYRWRYAEK
jgi:2-hydroxy-3-keto-5-methylthiopentenyl-1-phosphate phosphatase